MDDEIRPTTGVLPGDVAYEATVSMAHANLVSLLLLALAVMLFVIPYQLLWSDRSGTSAPVGLPSLLLIVAIFLLAIVVHELLHALGFVLVGRAPLASIKFGVLWRALAPYAHCSAPVTVTAYRFSVALPGVVLGLAPGLVGVLIGSGWLAYMGALMTAAAGGDLAVLLAIRSLPGDRMVRDHPSEPGCLVLKEEPNGYNAE